VNFIEADMERERLKLMNRVKRIKGQIAAVERALGAEDECPDVLMQLAAVRGGVNSLMAEVLEDHIRLHMLGKGPESMTEDVAEDLIDLVRAYLK
jgi:DNA-binding FrmR family transcriptional regulator